MDCISNCSSFLVPKLNYDSVAGEELLQAVTRHAASGANVEWQHYTNINRMYQLANIHWLARSRHTKCPSPPISGNPRPKSNQQSKWTVYENVRDDNGYINQQWIKLLKFFGAQTEI